MSQQTDNFYNRFSIFYPLVDMFLRSQKRRLFQEINELPFGHLLEMGVGNGTHLKFYKSRKITGIDTSSKMLKNAVKINKESIEFIQMKGEALLFKDQIFDYVIISHVIAVVDDPEELLSEAYRVLKRGGKLFILNHFTPQNWLRHLDYSFQTLSKIFHFRSVFEIGSLNSIKKFVLLKEINLDRFAYFKIQIYGKS